MTRCFLCGSYLGYIFNRFFLTWRYYTPFFIPCQEGYRVQEALQYPACRFLELHHANLNIHTTWQVQIHERVNSFWSWTENIDQTFVNTHFVLLLSVFIGKR